MRFTQREIINRVLSSLLVRPVQRAGQARKMSNFYCGRASYERLKEVFISNGQNSKYDSDLRRNITARFERIDSQVNITSTPTDGLFLAEAMLSLKCEGAAVECGCFTGGSTAKLSIVAQLTNRELVVFDSFEGLPEVDEYNLNDHHMRRTSARNTAWTAGRYAAQLDLVKSNVERYGELSSCRFVKGWFKDTLTESNLPGEIALTFTDVDIASSARDCIESIWPRLADGGVFFSHDAAYIKVLQALSDPALWLESFREPTPIFFGAGYGLCDASPHLGFMVKGGQPADYIKEILIEK